MSKDEFLALLQKSEAIDQETLEDWLSQNSIDDVRQIATRLVKQKLLTTWQAKYLLSGRYVLKVNNYLLLERISRDDHGDVFLAKHLNLKRKVNIRFLPGGLAKDAAKKQRFIKRVSHTSELDHANLVHVYDIDEERKRFFLVSEHVDGQKLADVALEDERQLGRFLAQAIDGLQYAHQHGVIHGAITSNSLLVTSDQQIKIDDLMVVALSDRQDSSVENDYQLLQQVAEEQLGKITGSTDWVRSLISIVSQTTNPSDLAHAFRTGVSLEKISGSGPPEADNTSALSAVPLVVEPIEEATVLKTDEASELKLEPLKDLPIRSAPIAPISKTRKKPKPEKTQLSEPPKKSPTQALAKTDPKILVGALVVICVVLLGGTIWAALSLMGPKDKPVAQANPSERQPNRKRKEANERLDERFAVNDKQDLAAQVAAIKGSEPTAAETNLSEVPPPVAEQVPQQNTPQSNLQPQNQTSPDSLAPKALDGNPPELAKPDQPGNQTASETPGQLESQQTQVSTNPAATAQSETLPHSSEMTEPVSTPATVQPKKEQPSAPKGNNKPPAKNQNGSKKATDKKSPQKSANPFSQLTDAFQIPLNTDTTKTILGNIDSVKGHYFAMKLETGPGIAKSKVLLELQPNHQKDLRRWNVIYKKRSSDPGVAVAEFSRDENEKPFYFRWLESAASDKKVNYLRNGLVHLEYSPKHKKTFRLRKLIKIDGFVLSQEDPEVKIDDVPDAKWLPNPNGLVVELQDLPEKAFGKTIVDETNITRKEPIWIFFSDIDYEQMCSVFVSADVRSRIRLYASLQIYLGTGKPQVAKASLVERAQATLSQIAESSKNEYQRFRNANVGEIRANLKKNKMIRDDSEYTFQMKLDREKQLKATADIAAERNKQFNEQITKSVPKILNQKIPIVISYKLGDRTIPFATTAE